MYPVQISWLSALLTVISVVSAILAYLYGMRPYIRAARFRNPSLPEGEDCHCPSASVVVYCQGGEEELLAAVDTLARQDYPDFEIIAVCDASREYAASLNERFATVHKNVYVTSIQPGSHNVGRNKLANTLGIKAAHGDVIVTTVGNSKDLSESWLSHIMAPFCGEQGRYIDVVLGLSKLDFKQMTGPLKWYRQFDSVLANGLWIGYAANGRPYRGDGYNLAFRRKVFFEHKGYAKTIYLHHGEDDLFIREISNGANTRVVVGPDSIVTTDWGKSANRVWSIRKNRYDFTARWLPKAPFFRSGFMMTMNWVVLLASVCAALIDLKDIVPAAVCGVTLLAFWGMEIFHYRRLAARLEAVRLWWAVVPFWLYRPIWNVIFKLKHYKWRKKNFTWQR